MVKLVSLATDVLLHHAVLVHLSSNCLVFLCLVVSEVNLFLCLLRTWPNLLWNLYRVMLLHRELLERESIRLLVVLGQRLGLRTVLDRRLVVTVNLPL